MAASSNLPYIQRFIYQQAYKNITVGIAPWWPAQRGSKMVLDRVGTDREGGKGFQLIPKDVNTDPDYSRWVTNYARIPPAGMGMDWTDIQSFPSHVQSEAITQSQKLAALQ
jgi:hypothetical protein